MGLLVYVPSRAEEKLVCNNIIAYYTIDLYPLVLFINFYSLTTVQSSNFGKIYAHFSHWVISVSTLQVQACVLVS